MRDYNEIDDYELAVRLQGRNKQMKKNIRKSTEKLVSIQTTEEYLKARAAEAAALVLAFNIKNHDSVVYLKLTENDSHSFQLHLRINDRFVNSKYYDNGTGYAYFSDAVYKEIERLAPKKVSWNNTASIGWLSY